MDGTTLQERTVARIEKLDACFTNYRYGFIQGNSDDVICPSCMSDLLARMRAFTPEADEGTHGSPDEQFDSAFWREADWTFVTLEGEDDEFILCAECNGDQF